MTKSWIKLAEKIFPNEISVFQLWSGINVWIERPHIVNRKLLATEIIQTLTLFCTNDILQNTSLKSQNYSALKINFSTELDDYLNSKLFWISNYSKSQHSQEGEDKHFVLKLRKLIPRNLDKFRDVQELVIIDETENSVTFWPHEFDVSHSSITPKFPYRIKLSSNKLILETFQESISSSRNIKASEDWLQSIVLPKVFKWCCNFPSAVVLPSLNLVSFKDYGVNYHYLKGKYGKKYVQIWPEISDPLKYVYEDIAIAAYLMTLWEKERNDLNLSTKQSFVDLGCGNGLLVDILTSEGHVGVGIDVRRRKIWDLYEPHTVLIERAVEPSDYNIFPNYDWIIGNHSDELTPWIPVIAARSHYNMKVFLLPCCSYTFNGKYKRSHPGKTQYQSYLSFIHLVCKSMGFNVEQDKLRIPSTKRICFVCTSRTYKEEEETAFDALRKEFINSHSTASEDISKTYISNFESENCSDNNMSTHVIEALQQAKENWIPNFKARESVEAVKNCSKLDRAFLEETVRSVANILLETENFISLQKDSKEILWNSGGKIKLGDLIKLTDPFILKSMKNQCGGFQTFLRNHRNVFTIKDGNVQLTVPSKDFSLITKRVGKRKRHRKKEYNFQEKPCYFFYHHPQGCPLESSECRFSHEIPMK